MNKACGLRCTYPTGWNAVVKSDENCVLQLMGNAGNTIVGSIILLPVHLLSQTPVDFSYMFRELRRLKEEKYDLKFKQRLTVLIAGNLFYLSVCWYNFLRFCF